MTRAFLLAHPAGHSLSPAMHNAAFRSLGLDARYELCDVAPDALTAAVERLREPDCYGANVTIPHKQAALALVDALSDAARAVGAINTIVRRGRELVGDNTDAGGFLRALAEAGFAPRGRRVLMLGAGGSARAVAFALLGAGVARLWVHNRTTARAAELAAAFAPLGAVEVVDADALGASLEACDLLVNTTSLGMAGGEGAGRSPLPAGALPRRALVVDLVYRPARTPLLAAAEGAGLAVQNGLPMLVYQGAESFERWTRRHPPIALMRAAAEAALRSQ